MDIATPDPWQPLRSFTAARIALGRTGTAIPLNESLRFKVAHAHARDAVYSSLLTDELTSALAVFNLPVYTLHSQAENRQDYLQRPDRGRKLDDASQKQLYDAGAGEYDIAFIIADGLSATAVNHHAVPLLKLVIPVIQQTFRIAPVTLVQQGRVAISDDIGALWKTKLAVILIGERPGLSSPNSMGIYLTYDPHPGRTDESRNCISNIRPEGLIYQAAAEKLLYFINESLHLKLSGIHLKDNSPLLP